MRENELFYDRLCVLVTDVHSPVRQVALRPFKFLVHVKRSCFENVSSVAVFKHIRSRKGIFIHYLLMIYLP